MDPSDELNLIQPVNPWVGHAWVAYTEYFQWSPEHNSNSAPLSVVTGQTLHGSLTYIPAIDSYNLTQVVIETGAVSSQIVKCQHGKKYTVPYIVYEKVTKCSNYPPEGKVTFFDIVAQCDGKDCTQSLVWSPKAKTPNCNMKAVINKPEDTVSITWDTTLPSRYDNMTDSELWDLNMASAGWVSKLQLQRPSESH